MEQKRKQDACHQIQDKLQTNETRNSSRTSDKQHEALMSSIASIFVALTFCVLVPSSRSSSSIGTKAQEQHKKSISVSTPSSPKYATEKKKSCEKAN